MSELTLMNRLTKAIGSAVAGFRHGGEPTLWGWWQPRTRIDYGREVGDKLDASVVMGPVQWVQRALPEARLIVKARSAKGEDSELDNHPMLALIQRPNEAYGDIMLYWGLVLSLLTDGNAYWMIARNRAGRPAELWYVPHWMLEPKWPVGGAVFIDHYLYTPGGGAAQIKVDPADVIHFRHGINPRNMRKGLSPIDSALREIFMDMESSSFVAALLRNMGVPSVVISPEGSVIASPADVEATKAWFQESFGGDNRGLPLVMGGPTKVTPYGFNPQQMNMSEARDVAEERICALIGIPAAVVGFGAGLQSTKVGATMEEMRKLAWHNGVQPLWRIITDELQRSLLPLFGNDASAAKGRLTVDVDFSQVPALQEDEDKETERWGKKLASGAILVSEYRQGIGLDVDATHDIYLRPINLIEVPKGVLRQAQDDRGEEAPPAEPEPKKRGQKPPRQAQGDRDEKHESGSEHDHPRASAEAYKRGAVYAQMLERQARGLTASFEAPLAKLFADMGAAAAEPAGELLVADALTHKARRGAKADDLLVETILDRLGIPRWAGELKRLYEAHYLEVAKAAAEAAERAGLGASLPDEVARAVVAAGGRRTGLVDIQGQTRAAMFEALAEGRAAGEGADALAARIGQYVEGGPWQSAETRARVIARTETKYAQNVSTIERGKAAGVERFVVFDGRLGPNRSKPDHIARDGSIVTAAEAARMAAAEHPNGTLSFAPHFGADDLGEG